MPSLLPLYIVASAVNEIGDLAVHYGASGGLFLATIQESLETIAAVYQNEDGSKRHNYKLYRNCPQAPFRRCIMLAPFRLFIIFTVENMLQKFISKR